MRQSGIATMLLQAGMLIIMGSPASAGRDGGRDLAGQIPRETASGAAAPSLAGWTPKPTTAPGRSPELLRMRKRTSSNTWENDRTCGWYASVSSSAMTCDESSSCATNTDRAVACVSGTYSPFFTACFDYAAFQAGACSSIGAKTGCCQDSSFGACGTYLWTGSTVRSQYRCLSQSSIFTMNDLPQFVIDEATRTTSSSTTSSLSQTSSSSSAVLPPTSTGQLSDGAGGPASNNSTVGIIVGAVLGGLALLVSVVAMILCCWCWKKRRPAKDSPTYIVAHSRRCKGDHLDEASCSHVS